MRGRVLDYESVFNESFHRILSEEGTGEEFFSDFYREFLASSPEVARRFRDTDMARQRKMLKSSFYTMLRFSTSSEVTDELAAIAQSHDRDHHDVPPQLYDHWLECLLSAVERHDAQFADDVELAWRLVMAKGIACMKFRYAR